MADAAPESPSESYKPPFDNEPDDYKTLRMNQEKKRKALLESQDRFQVISHREDRSDFPALGNWCKSKGKYVCLYRGFDICKDPEDLLLIISFSHWLNLKLLLSLGHYLAVWKSGLLIQ